DVPAAFPMEISVNPIETHCQADKASGGEDSASTAVRDPGILRSIQRASPETGRDAIHIAWFPHAGAGAASLVRPCREAPRGLDIHAVQLPGREDRFHEPPVSSLGEATREAAEEIAALSGSIILAGHSLGGLLAYGVALELTQRGVPPLGLIVMAMSSPDRLAADESLSHLDDAAFVESLDSRYGGIPDTVRDNPEALAVFLPVVRNDLALLDGYRYETQPALPFPICALAGSSDRAADRISMSGWRKMTSKGFTLRVFSGNHFFPLQHFGRVLEMAERKF
ncbi:MAG: alpha/beta fold hydrolase, partial [Planctomycetota bacterium]